MSTEIPGSTAGSRSIRLRTDHRPDGTPVASVTLMEYGTEKQMTNVFVADLLAAVAAECGVIIIDRNDLPKVHHPSDDTYAFVQTNGGADGFSVGPTGPGAQFFRNRAISDLAKAEYLDAHPPMDMEQYADLVALIAEHDSNLDGAGIDNLARRLLSSGRIEVTR
jgi:hypothetical protein